MGSVASEVRFTGISRCFRVMIRESRVQVLEKFTSGVQSVTRSGCGVPFGFGERCHVAMVRGMCNIFLGVLW